MLKQAWQSQALAGLFMVGFARFNCLFPHFFARAAEWLRLPVLYARIFISWRFRIAEARLRDWKGRDDAFGITRGRHIVLEKFRQAGAP